MNKVTFFLKKMDSRTPPPPIQSPSRNSILRMTIRYPAFWQWTGAPPPYPTPVPLLLYDGQLLGLLLLGAEGGGDSAPIYTLSCTKEGCIRA